MIPLSSIGSVTAPTLTSPRAAAAPAPVNPQDQATLTGEKRIFPRLGRVLKEIAFITAMAAGIAMTGLGGGALMYSATQGPALLQADRNLTPHQHQLASEELQAFGQPTVRWLEQRGVTIQITDSDAEVGRMLEEYGILHGLDRVQVAREAVEVGAALDQVVTGPEYQARLKSTEKLLSEAGELHRQWAEKNGLPTMPGFSGFGLGGAGMAGMLAQTGRTLTPRPAREGQIMKELMTLSQASLQSFKQAAGSWGEQVGFLFSVQSAIEQSGASSQADQADFRALLQAANGERLARAQAEGLAQVESQVALLPEGPAREAASAHLADLQAHPDKIPLNGLKHGLVAPPVRYLSLGDRSVVLSATDSSGFGDIQAQGLHFPRTDVIQVDADQLGQPGRVLSHEVGHAIEDQLRESDPEFYRDFQPRLKAAFEKARQQPAEAASGYGLKNPAEYLAEGVRLHFESPELLSQKDPALAGLTREVLERAATRPTQNPMLHALMLLGGVGLIGAASWLRRTPSL
ncbi:MAG: hypothetical protein AMXMBFR33_49330 [Candidatus Xenobia bacterium]